MARYQSLTSWAAGVKSRPQDAQDLPIEIAGPQSYFRRQLSLTPGDHGFDLLVSIEPKITNAQYQRLSWNKQYRFIKGIGELRYADAAVEFSKTARALEGIMQEGEWYSVESFPRRYTTAYRPYAPAGPWEYVPPTAADDWRTRARMTMPRSDLAPALVLMGMYIATTDRYRTRPIDAIVTEGTNSTRVHITAAAVRRFSLAHPRHA